MARFPVRRLTNFHLTGGGETTILRAPIHFTNGGTPMRLRGRPSGWRMCGLLHNLHHGTFRLRRSGSMGNCDGLLLNQLELENIRSE